MKISALKLEKAQRSGSFLQPKDDPDSEISKVVRAIRKKLRQIEMLETKQSTFNHDSITDGQTTRQNLQYIQHKSNQPTEDGANFSEEPKLMSASLVKAAKQFDALVASLPISETGEEVQLKRIAELQAENDAIGQELQKQLEAAEKELNQVQELYSQATDNCLNLKKPDIS
ncbi:hypothetical protein KIW84_031904 [Lathyrus oleraceus]|uniref:Mediator of RNA polymerase II transcription subunit 21 n=1 Tax=Pisum sativum TaxID=3888 RepID=A0A9D5AY27_PEA|nr:hypothetical protein KIW84_031904 [Pisum sativum]